MQYLNTDKHGFYATQLDPICAKGHDRFGLDNQRLMTRRYFDPQ